MNLTRLPEDCSLEDIHSHLYVLISIGTALAEAQRWMNIPALPLQKRFETRETWAGRPTMIVSIARSQARKTGVRFRQSRDHHV
jgi:hypothetical protein